jgi:two-component system cell cycle response regulator
MSETPNPLLEKVISCPALPSLPGAAMRVLELTRKPNVRLEELARVVETDSALCAKVLRTVNSSFYGLTTPCPTISRALAYLGLATVKSLVLSFSLVDWTKQHEGGLDLVEHWRRTIHGAAAARRVALLSGRCDPDEAFVAAMMRDVGVLAILTVVGDDYLKILAKDDGRHSSLAAREREYMGFDHAQAGAALIERWRLPATIVQATRLHHSTDRADLDANPLAMVVAVATKAAEALSSDAAAAYVTRFKRLAAECFAISETDARQVLRDAADDGRALARLFQMDTGKPPNVTSILAEAQEVLLEQQLTVQRETESLRQSNDALTRQTMTDGLTGVGNRKRFDQELDHRMGLARSLGGTVALIFTDIDRFKSFNDTYGHQVGDAVLMEFARRLCDAAGQRGVVCRYGGEEFAIVAGHCRRAEAAVLAEELRAAIASTSIDLRPYQIAQEPVSVTASFGVSVFEPATAGGVLESPSALVQAADKALYAAKQAGRNCVRVAGLKPRNKKAA